MKRLGYTRYGAQGGDVGALIGKELGILKPEGLVGVHLQQIFAFPSGAEARWTKLTPFESEGFANLDMYQKYDGYQHIQQKRPGTLVLWAHRLAGRHARLEHRTVLRLRGAGRRQSSIASGT